MTKYLMVGALMALAVSVSTSASAADAGAMGAKSQSADALVPSLVAATVDMSIGEPVTLAQVALGGIGFDAASSFSAPAPIEATRWYEAAAPPRAELAHVAIYSTNAADANSASIRSTG